MRATLNNKANLEKTESAREYVNYSRHCVTRCSSATLSSGVKTWSIISKFNFENFVQAGTLKDK